MWYRDRDSWAITPPMAAKVVILCAIAGIAALLAGHWVAALIFLGAAPIAVFGGLRGWRQDRQDRSF